MRRIKMLLILILVVVLAGAIVFFGFAPKLVEKGQNKVEPHDPYVIGDAVNKKHQSLVIMDWHCDSLLWNRDLLTKSDYGHVDLPRLQEGNVGIQMFTVVTKSPSGQNYEQNKADTRDNITLLAVAQLWPPSTWTSLRARALHQADKLHKFASNSDGRLRIVQTAADLKAVLKARDQADPASRPVAALLGLEGCHALDGELSSVDALYDAGYRMIGLHHFFDNKLGGSLHGISNDGLTEFGREVVKRLEQKQIIIDLAHSSPKVVEEVLAMSTRPVVVSHTGMKGVCDIKRNIPDDLMKKIAAKGGIVSIGYWDAVCDITPAGIVKTIRYAIDLIGEDHVALGSDYDGSTTVLMDTSELAILTRTMMDQGFTDTEIEKVMGGNSLRFLLANLP